MAGAVRCREGKLSRSCPVSPVPAGPCCSSFVTLYPIYMLRCCHRVCCYRILAQKGTHMMHMMMLLDHALPACLTASFNALASPGGRRL